jgi:hypothetical protein
MVGSRHRFLSAVYPDGVVLIGDCDVWSTMSRQYKLLLASRAHSHSAVA